MVLLRVLPKITSVAAMDWWVGGRLAGWGWSHSLGGLTFGLLSTGSLVLKEAVLGFLMW